MKAFRIPKSKENDTRQLFNGLLTRKADNWIEINSVHFLDLTAEQQAAFLSKPILDMSELENPMSYMIVLDKKTSGGVVEYHGIRHGGKDHFYVNTEGFDYPRYLFRVSGVPKK